MTGREREGAPPTVGVRSADVRGRRGARGVGRGVGKGEGREWGESGEGVDGRIGSGKTFGKGWVS